MSPLDNLSDAMSELLEGFSSHVIVGNEAFGFTTYTFWMLVAVALLVAVIFAFKRRQAKSIVPEGVFVNGVEFVIEYIKDDICMGLLPKTWKEHFPFLMTVFFFVLANNIVGILPGCHPGTGTIGVTAALATCSFAYFVYVGVKKMGLWGYIKSMAPAGVMFPLNVLVGLIEFVSNLLRPVTLAIRLFCNMYAGHVVMGTFAVLASLFVEPMLQDLTVSNAVQAGASVFWVLLLIVIYLVEMLVAVIQAYVFTLLSAVYVQLIDDEVAEAAEKAEAAAKAEAAKAEAQDQDLPAAAEAPKTIEATQQA